MSEIVFNHVYKRYGKVEVINDLNLTISKGKRVVLLGPSGCGKTTILRMIAGLEDITSGELYMGGKKVNDIEPGERNVAMVFQNYALYPHMTVEKNILFGLEIAKVPRSKREENLEWVLNILELTQFKKRFPRELSGGQRQRVALCRALIKRAPFFLLDEPLSNLDAQLRTSARSKLVEIHGVYHPTFIYVTHDQVEAVTIGQEIIILNNKVIQQHGTPEEIYNKPKNVFVANFIGSPSMNVCFANIENDFMLVGSSMVKIPDNWRKVIGKRKKIKYGLRPEDFLINRVNGDIDVNIKYVENQGNRKLLVFKIGDDSMTATTDPSVETHDKMSISFKWERMSFFDVDSDENIGYPQEF